MTVYVIAYPRITFDNYQSIFEELVIELNASKDGLVIDLEQVSMMDSAGMSVFISLYQTAQNENKEIRIIGANEKIFEFFHITRIHTLIDVSQLS